MLADDTAVPAVSPEYRLGADRYKHMTNERRLLISMPDVIAVMKNSHQTIALLCGIALTGLAAPLIAQNAIPASVTATSAETLVIGLPNINNSSERWYQVEVTLFLHSFYDPQEEAWQQADSLTASPAGTTRLLSLTELLALPEWSETEQSTDMQNADQSGRSVSRTSRTQRDAVAVEQEAAPEPLINGPEPAHQSDFRIPDPVTDGFIALTPDDWNFSETNAALQRSAGYRVLYHNAWRQPMRLANATQDMVIQAGQQVGDRYELEGTLRFYFNNRRDRIILDNQLLLNIWGETETPGTASNRITTGRAQASATGEAGSAVSSTASIAQSIPVMTTRELRSDEFHYLDHPVVGALVEVFPYELEVSE